MSTIDKFIISLDKALRTTLGVASSSRPTPTAPDPAAPLDTTERRHSAGLMRINHVGEVCAQALYDAQGRFSNSPELKQQFAQAGKEEADHLAWTAHRLRELGARPSLLNPLWYGGSFVLGALAAKMGDQHSLGFVVETERQVEAHLEGHLKSLPEHDVKSRAIVDQMRIDEIEHGASAKALGAKEVPFVVQKGMQLMAKVMTTTAYYF